jgi:uncharacterized protein
VSGAASLILIVAAFITSLLSAIIGMAGGLVLMGVLAFIIPVSAAFVTHGIIQLVASGWRAILQRDHIQWRILGVYGIAATGAAALVFAIAFAPSKPLLFLLLGLVPLLVWLPKGWAELDASKPAHAMAAGFSVTFVNLTAGVAGPLLDIFFVRTTLNRHQIVATKAATQVFSHVSKIIVYGSPLLMVGSSSAALPPLWVFAIAIPASMLGTVAGGRILDRISDAHFKRWSAWVVTGIGIFYLVQAARLWG